MVKKLNYINIADLSMISYFSLSGFDHHCQPATWWVSSLIIVFNMLQIHLNDITGEKEYHEA